MSTMHMSMNRVLVVVGISLLSVAVTARTVSAQYRPAGPPTVGDVYHIEGAYAWWNADPELSINSEALGIIGSDIDLITDLGIEKQKLRNVNLTLRPAPKHKFRFE